MSLSTFQELESLIEDKMDSQRRPLNLISRLCQALNTEDIAYCHWKSNNALDRSASGENDLDLLVSRADAARFTQIIASLGFKQAVSVPEKQMSGVLDYYGHDEASGRLVHIHAHHQLVLGHDMTKNYRLPIEDSYIDSSIQDEMFKIPSPEFEFIVLVIRVMLKHSTWDVFLGKDSKIRNAERQELDYLQARIDQHLVKKIIQQQLPYIGIELFDKCVQALQPKFSRWVRFRTGQQLLSRLQANSKKPFLVDAFQKQWRRWALKFRRRLISTNLKHRLSSGGIMVAIVGGDGAGKTTLVDNLNAWLSKDFDTLKVHLGKPPESLTTILVRGILRTGTLLGIYPHLNSSHLYLPESRAPRYPGKIPWMLREACKARDRYFVYLKARRFVNNGGIVICDRFPLPEIKLMDGPVVEQLTAGSANRFEKFLMGFEKKYYQAMTPPELVFVLRLNPEEAVRRKTTEDPVQVRVRSTEIWGIDWQDSCVHLIDAHQPQLDVLSSVKSQIWSLL